MKQYFRHMSLVKKATFISIISLVLPTVLFALYLYSQQSRQLYAQAYKDRTLAIEQLADNIETTLLSTEDLSMNLTYRSKISNLIARVDLDDYPVYTKRSSEDILTALKYSLRYQSSGLLDVCIYTDNPGLKDVDHFYQDSALHSLSFYQDFRQNDKSYDIYYLSSGEADLYYQKKGTVNTSSQGVILLARDVKGTFTAGYNGLLIFEANPSVFFSQMSDYVDQKDGYTLYFENLGNTYGSDFPDALKQTFLKRNCNDTLLTYEGQVYLFRAIESYPIFLVNTTDFNRLQYILPAVRVSVLMILMACVQFLILRFLIKYIFGRINHNITQMDQIIANGFSGTIPVTSQDEIGLVAQRYNTLLAKINTLVEDIVRKETDSKNAQIKALQYQMNPHFIYNTLSIFAGNAEQNGNHQLSEAIAYFGHLLRYNIKNTGLYSTVAQEIQNARSLIYVYSMRYRGKLSLTIDIPEDLNSVKLIKYLLQPLLENAIFHGKRKGNENMNINIHLSCSDTQMIFKICDDGIGMTEQRLEEVRDNILYGSRLPDNANSNSSFIGLHNVYKRLQLVYGSTANLEIESIYNEGTCVTVTLPILKETGGA